MSDHFEFEIYRLRLEKPRQMELGESFPERDKVIISAIQSKPTVELKQTVKWHIGNVEISEGGWMYFFVGKTSLKKHEHFNEESRDFEDRLNEHSPFTYIVLNPKLGILGIAKRSKVAANTKIIANRLERLLNSSSDVFDARYEAVIKDITDPHGFMSKVRSSHSVKAFTYQISPTNPIDNERRYHETNKQYVDECGADNGSVKVKGANLEKTVILSVAVSVNAVGDDASATIQQVEGKKTITIHLKGDPAKVNISEEQISEFKAEQIIQEAYDKVKKLA